MEMKPTKEKLRRTYRQHLRAMKTDEKTDIGNLQKSLMSSGKIGRQNRRKLTKKLTKTHFK